MPEITTIRVQRRTKEDLDRFKVHPREPYDDLIRRIMVRVKELEGEGNPREEALQDFVERMRRGHGGEIQDMIVYGSYARGEDSEESDVDILIIWSGELVRGRRAAADIATQVLIEYGILISPKLASPEGYGRMLKLGVPFARNVEREGIRIG